MLHNRIYERLSFNNFKKTKCNNIFLQNVSLLRSATTNKTFQEIGLRKKYYKSKDGINVDALRLSFTH